MSHPLLRLLRTYASPHWLSYAAGGVFLLITNYLGVSIPVEIGRAVDALAQGGAGLGRSAALVAVMGAGVIVVRSLSRILIFNPGRAVEHAIRCDLFDALMVQQPGFYAERTTGDLVSRATHDISFVRALVGFGLMQVVNVTMAVGFTGWKMLELSWELTLAAMLPVAVAFGIVQWAINRIFLLHHAAQRQLGALSDHVLGSYQGIATIQGFVAEADFERRFHGRNDALFRTRMSASWLGSTAFPTLMLAGGVAVFVVLYFGGSMAIAGELSVGDVAAYAALLGVLLPPLRSLGWMLSVVRRGQASLERIFEILDAPVDRPEGDTGVLPESGAGPGFSFKQLSFAYPDAPDRNVLSDVTAEIPPGALVGVFGRTGSGKSTLLRLIARLFNPNDDSVRVVNADGRAVDVRSLDLDAWRRQLAVAPQRPFLFSDTISANISLADDPDPVRLERSVRLAALAPDIAALPDGLETVVGERGIMLSGGQRQRVALARAMHRGAPVLLLDDVLSAVDHETEARLLASIGAGGAGRPTTFIVSHRMSAIRHADVILVLEDGRLVATGTHVELTARPGPYQDAWETQRAAEESA